MDVPANEVTELKSQIASLSNKVEELQGSIQTILQILARQDGSNLPRRLFDVENTLAAMKIYQAERSWIPEQVKDNKKEISQLRKFQFMITGALVFIQIVSALLGKVLLDKLWPH